VSWPVDASRVTVFRETSHDRKLSSGELLTLLRELPVQEAAPVAGPRAGVFRRAGVRRAGFLPAAPSPAPSPGR
jgi:hypothetical protein